MNKYDLDIIKNEAFPYLHDEKLRDNIMIDHVSARYVTIDKYFKTMVYLIEMYLSNHKETYSLLDAFAGVGSDTIGFLTRYVHDNPRVSRFKPIYAVEKDNKRYEMLLHNTLLYLQDYNINRCTIVPLNTDMLYILESRQKYDIVYLDPPWGDNYQTHSKVKIFIANIPIETIVNMIIENKTALELIIIKLPKNYDYTDFKKLTTPFVIYQIFKADNSVYMNIMIIICNKNTKKEYIKTYGWNFKRLETHLID